MSVKSFKLKIKDINHQIRDINKILKDNIIGLKVFSHDVNMKRIIRDNNKTLKNKKTQLMDTKKEIMGQLKDFKTSNQKYLRRIDKLKIKKSQKYLNNILSEIVKKDKLIIDKNQERGWHLS